MLIDTHQHFWHYSQNEYGWITDEMAVLRRNFLPEDLQPLLEPLQVLGTVAIQARQTLEETIWLLQLAERHDWILGVVGWVDLCSPRVLSQLERFSEHPKFVGVRHVIQDEPDDQFLLGKEFCRGIDYLSRFNLTYDILIYPRQLPAAAEFVRRFPEQRFVLDHLAKPFIRDQNLQPWEQDLRRLAESPNVCCKISGMVTEADWRQWRTEDFTPYMEVVLEAFGAKRVMLGSDFPVCTVAATYARVMDIPLRFIASCSEEERKRITAENARRFYQIKV